MNISIICHKNKSVLLLFVALFFTLPAKLTAQWDTLGVNTHCIGHFNYYQKFGEFKVLEFNPYVFTAKTSAIEDYLNDHQVSYFFEGTIIGAFVLITIFSLVFMLLTKIPIFYRVFLFSLFSLWLTLLNHTRMGALIVDNPLAWFSVSIGILLLLIRLLHEQITEGSSRRVQIVMGLIFASWVNAIMDGPLVLSIVFTTTMVGWYLFESYGLFKLRIKINTILRTPLLLGIIILPTATVFTFYPYNSVYKYTDFLLFLYGLGITALVIYYLTADMRLREKLATTNLSLSQELGQKQIDYSEKERHQVVRELQEDLLNRIQMLNHQVSHQGHDVKLDRDFSDLLEKTRRYTYQLFPPYVQQLNMLSVLHRELDSRGLKVEISQEINSNDEQILDKNTELKRMFLSMFRVFLDAITDYSELENIHIKIVFNRNGSRTIAMQSGGTSIVPNNVAYDLMNILGGRLNHHQNNGTQWVFELPSHERSKADKIMKLMIAN
jgi:hypothetical protein